MSARALKKAQKQLEEQKHLQEQGSDDDSSDDSVAAPIGRPKPSAFALLGEVESEDAASVDDEAHDDEEELHGTDQKEVKSNVSQQPAKPKSTIRKSKKKKKKAAKAMKAETEEEDDVDELLDSLARNAAQAKSQGSGDSATGPGSSSNFCNLLAVDTSNLHVINEMRKLFGRDAVEAERRETHAAGRRDGRTGPTNRLAAIARRRNIFVQGKDEWPSAPSGGLGMEIVTKGENGVVEFRFVHSTAYQEVQRQFEIAVASMDPQRLVAMLQHNPYHVATLSQVSEIAKQQGDPSGSGELLERALFTFGRSVHSTFAAKLAEGKARMDFRRPENREFALVIWRYTENLKLRATWRTVFEWNKLLFALDPIKDMYCIALVLDQYALRARHPEYLVQLADDADFQNSLRSYGEPSPFFGLEASVALACFQLGDQAAAQKRLHASAGKYPWLYSALYRELQLEPIPPAIWGKLPPDEGNELLTSIYTTRAKDIWTEPEATSFLTSALKSLPRDSVADASSQSEQECFKEEAFIRHVILSDKPQWIGLLPEKPESDALRASDPVPPADNLESYHVEVPQMRAIDEAQARRILEQIQQLALRGRGAGGEGFAEEEHPDGLEAFQDEEEEE